MRNGLNWTIDKTQKNGKFLATAQLTKDQQSIFDNLKSNSQGSHDKKILTFLTEHYDKTSQQFKANERSSIVFLNLIFSEANDEHFTFEKINDHCSEILSFIDKYQSVVDIWFRELDKVSTKEEKTTSNDKNLSWKFGGGDHGLEFSAVFPNSALKDQVSAIQEFFKDRIKIAIRENSVFTSVWQGVAVIHLALGDANFKKNKADILKRTENMSEYLSNKVVTPVVEEAPKKATGMKAAFQFLTKKTSTSKDPNLGSGGGTAPQFGASSSEQ